MYVNRNIDNELNIGNASRQELVDAHIIHEFDSSLVKKNHESCYGTLIAQRYRELLPLLKGKKVIDCGCGFGTFTKIARQAGFTVHPVDIDEVSIELAREINQIEVHNESIYQTSLENNSTDVAVCFDSIQHFNIPDLISEFKRIGIQQVLIYDSNIHNPLLKLYRRIKHHEESHELNPNEIISIFQSNGFRVISKKYENIIALPASGGFQQKAWLAISRYPQFIAKVDNALLKLINFFGMAKWVSFRFLIVLEANDKTH